MTKLGLADKVTFAGFVLASEVRTWFDVATVAVLPYRRAEQSGVASLAVAAGTPVLTSDVGELAQLSALPAFRPGDTEALAGSLERFLATSDVWPGGFPGIDAGGDLSSIVRQTVTLYEELTAVSASKGGGMSTVSSSVETGPETGPDLVADHTPQPDDQRATAQPGDQQAKAASRPRLRVRVYHRTLTVPAEGHARPRVWAPPAHKSASDSATRATLLRSRLRALLPAWAGLVAIVALEPFRAIWPVALVLTALTLTVPGVVALRALRVSGAALVRYPLYIPAASLAVVMAGGLAADLLGPLLGDAHPLSNQTAAFSVLLLSFLLSLAGAAAPTSARFPWRAAMRRPELLLPLALPLLAAGGALLLNNGHGAGLARFTAAAGIFVLLGCLVRADRMSRASVAMVLFACALAAEWAFSLRSQEIVGYDISSEIHIAQYTLQARYLAHGP